ncbi:hypothetical protein L6164_036618 [Bauhinia variegata]|uniref:Uncharacterized protein n=1 Tax=Bauhinia variegata TaxID=167791 RepID=A0ACB9KHP2_BAUVA|nr:hypothetical protein L6164_036618 [Bauhinia variegata]
MVIFYGHSISPVRFAYSILTPPTLTLSPPSLGTKVTSIVLSLSETSNVFNNSVMLVKCFALIVRSDFPCGTLVKKSANSAFAGVQFTASSSLIRMSNFTILLVGNSISSITKSSFSLYPLFSAGLFTKNFLAESKTTGDEISSAAGAVGSVVAFAFLNGNLPVGLLFVSFQVFSAPSYL